MFWLSLERFAPRTALHCPEAGPVSFRELQERADEFRRRLGERRSLLLLLTDDSVAAIAAYLGALRGGHAVLLADARNEKLAANLARTYRPDATYRRADGRWNLCRAGGGGDLHPDLALVLSTSGSTGSAKCVRLSYDNLQANTESIVRYLRIAPTDRAALTLPLHYCYGLSVLHTHLAAGACTFVGAPTMASAGFLGFLHAAEITSFAGVPYSFELLERRGFRSAALPALRYVTQAGGRMAPALVEKYAHWALNSGREFFVMYGQTEATARMAYMPADVAREHPSCIGGPIPGGRLALRAATGERIEETDVPGELVYTGPNVMLGYAQARDDLARGAEVAQLATGDIACRNRDGLFRIVGRKNRISKLFGIRLHLGDAEQLLEKHGIPAVCVSDDERLYLVLGSAERSEAARELIHREYSLPLENTPAVVMEEIPRLPSGKIDYEAVRTTARAKAGPRGEGGDRPEDQQGSVRERLQRLFAKTFHQGPVQPTDSFVSLGGDSLRYVQVSIGIGEILGTMPQDWETRTIEDLASEARSSAPSRGNRGATLESGVALRALAILFIVAHHAGLPSLAGGAQLLLLASGLYFVRFQGGALARGRILSVLGNCARNFLIPYLGVLLAYQAIKHQFHLPDLLLYDNLIGTRAPRPFPTWFMQALLQSLVLFSLPFLFSGVRRRLVGPGYSFSLVLLAFAAGGRAIDGFLGYGSGHEVAGKDIGWVFWLFCLGAVIFHARTHAQKGVASVLSVVLPFLFYSGDWSRVAIITIGALILLWVPHVKVTSPLKNPIRTLSVSSYFIYMLHLTACRDFLRVPMRFQVGWLVAGLALGVLGWTVYDRLGRWTAPWRRPLRARQSPSALLQPTLDRAPR